MTGLVQELLEMVDSEYFPDWALEAISARLAQDSLTLQNLIAIISEAHEDMMDLKALSEEPPDQEVYTLGEVKQALGYL